MVRRKPEPLPPTPEILALREAVLRDVLTALDDLWGVPQTRVAPPSVHRKLAERAEAAIDQLTTALGELTDKQRPEPQRFRRAWELSPTTCIGQDIDEVILRAVAALTARKIARLQHLSGLLRDGRASTNDRTALSRLVEECESPPRPPNEWVYLAEAVRAGAEDLPELVAAFQPEPEEAQLGPVDPLPFMMVVLDAFRPGTARGLGADAARKAAEAWGERVSRDADKPWDLVAKLVHPPMEIVSAETMRRRWRGARDGVRLDRAVLVGVLSSKLRAIHRFELPFAPKSEFTRIWVRILTTAVRSAMPKRELDAAVIAAATEALDEVARTLPGEFVLRATDLLPPAHEGGRGRPSIPAQIVLAGLLDHLNSSREWHEIPHGRTIEAHYGMLQQSNRVEALTVLAREYGLLSVPPRATGETDPRR